MQPFRLIFKYARRYTLQLTITMIAMLLLVGVQLLVPWIIKTLIEHVTSGQATQTAQLVTTLSLLGLGIFVHIE